MTTTVALHPCAPAGASPEPPPVDAPSPTTPLATPNPHAPSLHDASTRSPIQAELRSPNGVVCDQPGAGLPLTVSIRGNSMQQGALSYCFFCGSTPVAFSTSSTLRVTEPGVYTALVYDCFGNPPRRTNDVRIFGSLHP